MHGVEAFVPTKHSLISRLHAIYIDRELLLPSHAGIIDMFYDILVNAGVLAALVSTDYEDLSHMAFSCLQTIQKDSNKLLEGQATGKQTRESQANGFACSNVPCGVN